MPPVSEVIFLNGFIYILKGWPVITPGLVRKGWNRWCSQWAYSPTALTSVVTNREMYWKTFVCVCVCFPFPQPQLECHTNFVLVIIRPSLFKHQRTDSLPETIPMATRHSPWLCLPFIFLSHTSFWGQNCTCDFLETPRHIGVHVHRRRSQSSFGVFFIWFRRIYKLFKLKRQLHVAHTCNCVFTTAVLYQQLFLCEFWVKHLMYLSAHASLCQCNRWKQFIVKCCCSFQFWFVSL